jgi:hypothetical protein
MPSLEPLSFSQPDNELTKIAEAERAKLFPKNDYKTNNQYSSVNPNALADGDERGRGTGNFLDVYNQSIGTRTDILERKNEIKVNEYQVNKPYTTPPA